MTVNLVQHYEYTTKFISCISVCNSFVFTTNDGLLIIDMQSDLFRSTADYKIFQTSLAYSTEKPFYDKNFKQINFERPVVCNEHNLTVYPNRHKWYAVYMGNYSNIIFLERNNDKWVEKLSDIPKKWGLIISKTPCYSLDKKKLNSLKIENRILCYCREKEKSLQIKNFIFTHILKHENDAEVYGTICCHINNVLTFWSTTLETSFFLSQYKFHNTPINYIKWFQISNELSWLIVFLINGQIYVHEICNYPDIDNTFILWSDEDFACVKNIWIENISNDMCLIFITKMSFLLIILYSLTQKKLLLTKKEIIPMTTFVAGFTYVSEKNLLIIVTDIGNFIYIHFFTIKSELTYTFEMIKNNFNEQVKNFTCTSVVFSKNQCTCVLTLECNTARYSKNDGKIKNKLLFCIIPENLVELEDKILAINNCDYNNVIDCIESLRIHTINDKSNELYQLDRKLLDKCSIQNLKLIYWKIAYKSKENEQDTTILQELQMLLHIRYLNSHFSNKKKKFNKSEQYYCRSMLSYYLEKLPSEYAKVKRDAAKLIRLFKRAKHMYFCNTCERILLELTDCRMFICEIGHKELRCPVTLGPLGMPCLVCSMCFTMANINAKNESCVWCFGKYVSNELLF